MKNRHGFTVLLVLLTFASFFFVYNNPRFTHAARDANDTLVGQQEHLRQPTEAPARVAKPHPPALEGYVGIIDHKPLRMHCETCSLVTSSGHLLGAGQGEEIDQAECVIRMNDAPNGKGYAQDVGRRTSLRVIAHSSMQRVLKNRQELLNTSQDTVFIFWGPSMYMRRDGKGLIYNNLKLMNQVLPTLRVYIISLQKMLQFDELFKKETGKDRRMSKSWLSTGWFTMTIALELCDRINVYGMVAPDYCREHHQHHAVPYHYYEPRGADECAMYISHERGRKGSHHRFITEKRVFADWARTFNIHFYQPEWTPKPLPANLTLEGTVSPANKKT
ncbi:alpha-N-acetylgalactosaminide alpha-2,6-sialyltransferase 5 isoform X2 [Notolabrus celidotus]|uniref:alpha-N-acetylgalactosaminide alpha-2,6-sialyltransferase 5 isoform X2 n=1 Tax=Notolabrus celidotus TaxID=1203425 RepID=UPI0014900B8E|nr:alpha-N-acetylgalactosaminide alpha-2,6-sialyltransferase 5 isoform X2 [Notolabrus celidotus]XP_034559837.1 alpha-N-acetylgalactosaminide alpha-2,6-sialyltransferase 5 isoform X2 [Notolabrus celidotus]XP_034559838.1 alpha-N-acetylgalactosaminide alpha-2,6-sialyltransferase 5 isoform X2 [Notolabrus celidotus]